MYSTINQATVHENQLLFIEGFVFWPQKPTDLLISRNHWGGDHFPGAQGAVRNAVCLCEFCYWGGGPLSGSSRCCQDVNFFCELKPWVWTFLSGLPGPGCVQRGGFLFKEFWTRIVFWPDTCLVELTKSYVQVEKSSVKFQSLRFK